MDRLWAPWRSKYIYLRRRSGCIFCGAKKVKDADRRYIIDRSAHSFTMLNIFPYNNGHVMAAPYRHVNSLELLSEEEILDLMNLVNSTKMLLDKKLRPEGYNIGFNIGKAGGAGFAGHLHVHIVPRWRGDSNFMPVMADTKVVSESLDVLHKALKKRPR